MSTVDVILNTACKEAVAQFRAVSDPALAVARVESALKAAILTAAMVVCRTDSEVL